MQKLTKIQNDNPAYFKAAILRGKSVVQPTVSKNKQGIRHLLTYQLWKSFSDRVIALMVLVILSPVMVIIALIIRIDSPGNPIFRQERVGRDGCTFFINKFRTMHIDNDDNEYRAYLGRYILENAPYQIDENKQPIYKVINDARVTRFGAILRKTNLDELPQFFNILMGKMSLIGPRPDIPFAVDMYTKHHRKRLSVKPGITGLWQIYGRKNLSFEDMVRFDLEYIEKQSLLLDIKILWQTAGIILSRDGS
jgi:lipopolysaccharide/colanic/teichoic acid biosynthesis glycosyltransferase